MPVRHTISTKPLFHWFMMGASSASIALLTSCGGSSTDSSDASSRTINPTMLADATVIQTASGAIPRAKCGPGSNPETGLQGQVSAADRQSGRSQQGYNCNLERIGQYQGEGASWVNPFYRNCAYMATTFSGVLAKKSPGVQVVDVTDPQNPRFSTNLTSPSMLQGTWESLKTNEKRGLLGGVAVGPFIGAAFFEVYDLNEDCANPVLQNGLASISIPANVLGHEGNWSPDGMTYWASGLSSGSITAIDVSNPKLPRIIYTTKNSVSNHGFSLSEDGNRLYMTTTEPGGIVILDVSDVQKRAPVPMVRQISSLTWNSQSIAQHSIAVTWGGKPYLIVADEGKAEAVKIIDISDETKPKLVNELKLEIHLPENEAIRAADSAGNGGFGYQAHYCTVDRRNDPSALACGFFESGVRVFNVVNPLKVTEIAYYNPPAQVGKKDALPGSEHASLPPIVIGSNMTTDWCTSPPRFVGSDQLWVTCQDNGMQVLRFTNNVYKKVTNSNNPKLEYRNMDD